MPVSTSESIEDDFEMDMDDDNLFDVLGCKNFAHEHHRCRAGRQSLHLHRRNLAMTQPLQAKQPRPSTSVRVRMRWHRLARMARTMGDPWREFQIEKIETETAVRHRYNAVRKTWSTDEVQIKMENKTFNHGAMRECFRLKKISSFVRTADWNSASNYVAKRYMDPVDENVYRSDVILQMDAKLWGEHYNRSNPPKKVDIMQMSLLEFVNREGKPFYHLEHYIEGNYIKYNSNSGFVDEQQRNTPHAFSHFTFERSGHKIIVVDIQGVGDLYTDPQIHTAEGTEYGDGNLGTRGMALFFHTHVCNQICYSLDLTEFDMAPSEKEDRERMSVSASSSEAGTVMRSQEHFGQSPKTSFKFDEIRARLDSGIPEDVDPDALSPLPPDNGFSRRRRLDTSTSENDSEIEMWHQQQARYHRPSRMHICVLEEMREHRNVLGQIHHEMTRYHEAGRFLIERERDPIDWEAAIYHEKMAAEYGYQEAMQTMAHYFLGLQHDVLSECPIKAEEDDMCKGIMYLTQSANQNERSSMIFLGECYERGLYDCQREWDLAQHWYQKAIDAAPEEEEETTLTPLYELQARMAEILISGEYGADKDVERAAELFNEAAEGATNAMKGRRAAQLFERAEIAYGEMEEAEEE